MCEHPLRIRLLAAAADLENVAEEDRWKLGISCDVNKVEVVMRFWKCYFLLYICRLKRRSFQGLYWMECHTRRKDPYINFSLCVAIHSVLGCWRQLISKMLLKKIDESLTFPVTLIKLKLSCVSENVTSCYICKAPQLSRPIRNEVSHTRLRSI